MPFLGESLGRGLRDIYIREYGIITHNPHGSTWPGARELVIGDMGEPDTTKDKVVCNGTLAARPWSGQDKYRRGVF
jgi:hypothetical protein